jgi:hypothetical protein
MDAVTRTVCIVRLMNAFHPTDAMVAVGPMTGSPLRRAKTAQGLMSPRNSCVPNATSGMSFSAATAPETSRICSSGSHTSRYSFGWEGGDEVPPGSSLIEIDLIDNDAGAGTLRRITHSGLPNAVDCTSLDKGWAYYLDRLAHAAANHDPGPTEVRHTRLEICDDAAPRAIPKLTLSLHGTVRRNLLLVA